MTTLAGDLDLLRAGVNCAAVLERLPPPWHLDRRGSTRRALKYRRAVGEIVIVNHDGRGWWDPQSQAKGDIFNLVQFLDPGLSFGQVCQVLRPFVGLPPALVDGLVDRTRKAADRPLPQRWARRPALRRMSPAWCYLTQTRGLPNAVIAAADRAGILREGPHGSAWFAHRDDTGQVSHIEIRGPDFKGSLTGGRKTLLWLASGRSPARRLAITEGPIDLLSLAAIEGSRDDTLYAATGGGMGPGSEAAIARLLTAMAAMPDAVLVSAADANLAGDKYAARHEALATAANVAFERLRPIGGEDFNDMLRAGKGL